MSGKTKVLFLYPAFLLFNSVLFLVSSCKCIALVFIINICGELVAVLGNLKLKINYDTTRAPYG